MTVWVVFDYDGPIIVFTSKRLADEYINDIRAQFPASRYYVSDVDLAVGYNNGKVFYGRGVI